jgi:uncharacterized protein YjiS (DUF1127 family)
MPALEHVISRPVVHMLPRASLEGFRIWRASRRTQRIERLAARQLAGLSPHMLTDIGVSPEARDRSPRLRLWFGGAT